MEDFSTYYDVLEIPETASQEDTVSAYRRLVKEYHPDKLVGMPDHLKKLRQDAEEKWREIQEAWSVIGDPTKRRQYDEALHTLRDGPSAQQTSSQTQSAPPSSPPKPPPPRQPPPPSGFAAASSGRPAPPSVKAGVGRGWSIALGWIVFLALLLFGEVLAQGIGRSRAPGPGWLAGAVFYSMFGAAVLAGVMITGLLQKKKTRATVAGIVSVASTVAFFVLLAIGARPEHPDLRVALPVEDRLAGNSLGYSSGVQWQYLLGDRGALFSAANASRIEYPSLIPREGTLEFWIKVEGGYSYSNSQLRTNQDDAVIFRAMPQAATSLGRGRRNSTCPGLEPCPTGWPRACTIGRLCRPPRHVRQSFILGNGMPSA